MRVLTDAQLAAQRLARSHLTRPAPSAQLVDVVRDVALIQAQILSAAQIGIGIRTDGITGNDVEDELYIRRSLVKAWGPRGTLHLIPADELSTWAAACRGDQPHWESKEWLARQGLTRRTSQELFDAIADSLSGQCLTRDELADAVADRIGTRNESLLSGWGEMLHPSTMTGALCFGPPRGRKVTFVHAKEWIGKWLDVDPHEARRCVLRRYLAAYGPAKVGDFQRWTGIDNAGARKAFSDLSGELRPVRFSGGRGWVLESDDREWDDHPSGIHLLPQYDAFIIGFRPRDPLVPEVVKERVKQDPRGRRETVTALCPLVVDGVITGLWRRQRTADGRVRIDVEHVVKLPRGRSAELESAISRVEEIAA